MSFRIGDRVDFLDEAGGGRITDFLGPDKVLVEADGGFEYPYPIDRLVKRAESEAIPYDREKDAYRKIREEEEKKEAPSPPSKDPPPEKLEVDLHIEELHDRPMTLSNAEIMELQLSKCRHKLDRAIQRRIPRVILIHGIGEGVLRSAVRDLLDREYPFVHYLDASFEEYGRGATEVRF